MITPIRCPFCLSPNPYPNSVAFFYKELVKSYVGLTGPDSPGEMVFICPSDQSIRNNSWDAFTSYTFNGHGGGPIPRITGQKLSVIQRPSKGVLVTEWPAFYGGSWHPVVLQDYQDAKNVVSFIDSHVGLTRIYWDGVPYSHPADYEPPAAYDYSLDGN